MTQGYLYIGSLVDNFLFVLNTLPGNFSELLSYFITEFLIEFAANSAYFQVS